MHALFCSQQDNPSIWPFRTYGYHRGGLSLPSCYYRAILTLVNPACVCNGELLEICMIAHMCNINVSIQFITYELSRGKKYFQRNTPSLLLKPVRARDYYMLWRHSFKPLTMRALSDAHIAEWWIPAVLCNWCLCGCYGDYRHQHATRRRNMLGHTVMRKRKYTCIEFYGFMHQEIKKKTSGP